tara:strand:- start:295 stop:1092 length:798 start_codon:yes stop_codon:yes gene_type:complete
MIDQDNHLLNVSNIAIKAGMKIMEYYSKDINFDKKEDNSPITKADLASNSHIINELNRIDNSIPILSEESIVDWQERKTWKKYWLIDPLDGTKEFINKNGEFTVNIAMIENSNSVLGIIYAPAKSILYFAKKNLGAFKVFTSSELKNFENIKPITTSKNFNKDNVRIIGSRSHSNKFSEKWIKENFKKYSLITKGSSLKFCEIADGNADIYPRFGPTSEWDIAAGHIILEEAGGKIEDTNRNKILYNQKESLINPEFIASTKDLI